MHSIFTVGLPVFLAFVAGQAGAQITCNSTSPCPSSAPCCSEYGFCDRGHFCLGGCNPFASKAVDSCRPNPICEDRSYTFTDTTRMVDAAKYKGDISLHDWVIEEGEVLIQNTTAGSELAMILTENDKDTKKGTKISSTRYVHYGKITASLKTGKWGGVITAFITMSDIKDEIDWEFTGNDITEGQSNFFWQGNIPDRTAGDHHGGLSDTFANYHDYTIDWQPEELTWSIDGKVVRSVKKSDTVDSAGVAHYPSTPARIQFSIWPAGIPESAPGTVEWAGGMINWQDPDYVAAGQFYALVRSVNVECAPPQQAGTNFTSYVYSSNQTVPQPQIAYSNRSTLLNGGANSLVALGGSHGLIVGAVTMFLVVFHAF